ncbi:uncharacterized protein LOC114758278 [Neltuma alba]|uniref:uncharacterized protein LOC114758278 n=1 Tax=Neltuma alba TaxID=207710 RepID=UPI0010A42F6D|nr:uncharacterized protein LOC114758278 [Prosopis alba]
MNCIFWNCRGTGSKALPGLVRQIQKRYNIDMLALFETKASGEKARQRSTNMGFMNAEIVDAVGYKGGIWVLWNEGVFKIQVIEKFEQGKQWPWIIGGDFNAILYAHERRSTAQGPSTTDRDFGNWFENMELIDLGCNGPFYTWKRQGCESQIDRVLANNQSMNAFPDATIKHLPWFKFDHRPILYQTKNEEPQLSGDRPFRMIAPWILHEDFARVVKESWILNADWTILRTFVIFSLSVFVM